MAMRGGDQFQSAPRVLLRGDRSSRQQGCSIRGFNPRPAFFCGATRSRSGKHQDRYVSIRAPRSSAGRPAAAWSSPVTAMFQSAPRVLLRGDGVNRLYAIEHSCFNPRPAFFCGATWLAYTRYGQHHCFNPRPAFFCGATVIASFHSGILQSMFQSAPRVLLRGDSARQAHTCRYHAMFQSAPRVLLRGDRSADSHGLDALSFNPRPAFFCGATQGKQSTLGSVVLFQSAPRVLLRGDVRPQTPSSLC